MNRLVTWLLVVVVIVLAVNDRKKAAVLKELQKQRRWVVQARDEWEGYREMMELHDEERGALHRRMARMAEVVGVEWPDTEEGWEEEEGETRGEVGLRNEY